MAKNAHALHNLAPPHANSSHHKEVCDGEDNFCLHPPYPDIYIIYMIYIKISYSYNLIFFVCKNKNILHSLIIICFFSTNNYNFFLIHVILLLSSKIFFLSLFPFTLDFTIFLYVLFLSLINIEVIFLGLVKDNQLIPNSTYHLFIFFYDLSFSRFSKKKKSLSLISIQVILLGLVKDNQLTTNSTCLVVLFLMNSLHHKRGIGNS